MKIKRISLRNFQSHVNTTFDLESFTILVGKSSSGKSSILRALDWLFYGTWDKTYPNDPDQETAVAIVLNNGSLIARFRKGNKQWAAIKDSDGVAHPFKDFGEQIPGLFDLVRVRPIELSGSSVNLNVSRQGDPAFMVHDSWSKPAKAQWLGRLYGAHVLTRMMKLMAADKRSNDAEFRRLETWIAERRVRYNELSGASEGLETLNGVRDDLERLTALSDVLESYYEILDGEGKLEKVSLISNIDTESLRRDINRLQELRECAESLNDVGNGVAEIAGHAGLLSLDLVKLRSDIEKADSMQELLDDYTDTVADLITNDEEHKAVGKEIKKLSDVLKDNLMADGKCPLCSSKKRMSSDRLRDRLVKLQEIIGN